MAAASKAPEFETRTRIVCHFPLNRNSTQHKLNQIHVIRGFVKHLQNSAITGFTMTSVMDAVCTGFWRPSLTADFEEENVVVFVIDHPLEKTNPKLWSFVQEIKREVQKLYQRYAGEKEQDVWIIIHTVDRLV